MPRKKVPPPMNGYKISPRNIKYLEVGQSCIVGPATASNVAREFLRIPGEYTQETVLVVPQDGRAVFKMSAVTRIQ